MHVHMYIRVYVCIYRFCIVIQIDDLAWNADSGIYIPLYSPKILCSRLYFVNIDTLEKLPPRVFRFLL